MTLFTYGSYLKRIHTSCRISGCSWPSRCKRFKIKSIITRISMFTNQLWLPDLDVGKTMWQPHTLMSRHLKRKTKGERSSNECQFRILTCWTFCYSPLNCCSSCVSSRISWILQVCAVFWDCSRCWGHE